MKTVAQGVIHEQEEYLKQRKDTHSWPSYSPGISEWNQVAKASDDESL